MKQDKYERALRRARAKKKLRSHMISSVVIIVVLVTINIMTDSGEFWAQWPMLGIGISLLFHAMVVMKKGHLEDYEERSIKKELSKYKKDKEYEDTDFDEEGDEDEVLELDVLPELRKDWKDSDFV